MKKLSVLLATALLAAACGGSADDSADTTAVPSVETTAAAETTTTESVPATEATTTTAAAETTTTAEATTGEAKGLDVLLSASESAAEMTSARIEGFMSVEGVQSEDLGTVSFEVPFTTVFDTEADAFSMVMDMSGMAGAVPTDEDPFAEMMLTEFEVRQIGEDAYVKMPFLTMFLDTDAEWILMPADETDTFTADMGVQTDPYEMLDEYRDANADVQDLGTESVNGVDATHYRVVIDGESYYASLSDEEKAQLEAEGPLPTGEFPIDLWISEEGYVVRMLIEFDGDEAELAPDEQFDRMTLSYDVFDINQPVEITAPDDFVAMDDLTGAFGDLEG
jgi:hypothetical protein